jgi:hypothetical protein
MTDQRAAFCLTHLTNEVLPTPEERAYQRSSYQRPSNSTEAVLRLSYNCRGYQRAYQRSTNAPTRLPNASYQHDECILIGVVRIKYDGKDDRKRALSGARGENFTHSYQSAYLMNINSFWLEITKRPLDSTKTTPRQLQRMSQLTTITLFSDKHFVHS